jgi:hypothetical protein
MELSEAWELFEAGRLLEAEALYLAFAHAFEHGEEALGMVEPLELTHHMR